MSYGMAYDWQNRKNPNQRKINVDTLNFPYRIFISCIASKQIELIIVVQEKNLINGRV